MYAPDKSEDHETQSEQVYAQIMQREFNIETIGRSAGIHERMLREPQCSYTHHRTQSDGWEPAYSTIVTYPNNKVRNQIRYYCEDSRRKNGIQEILHPKYSWTDFGFYKKTPNNRFEQASGSTEKVSPKQEAKDVHKE